MPTKTEKTVKVADFVARLRENEVSEVRVPIQWLDYQLPDPKDQRDYARERCRVVVTETIGEAIEKSGMTRVQIAKKLGVTKGHISQVLNGSRNMTLHTLGDLLWACGAELHDLATRDLGVVMASVDAAAEWRRSCIAVSYETSVSPPGLDAVDHDSLDSAVSGASANLALAACMQNQKKRTERQL
jgi:transcriptional regulator with XRE-family HTH domain